MKNGKTIIAALGLLAAAAGPAAAQDVRGIYLGGSGFATQYEHACENLIVACDETDFGGRAFAGYRFNRYFSTEVGVATLGKTEAAGTVGGVPVTATVETLPVWDVSALVSFPVVGALEAFGRLGLYLARVKTDTNIGGVTEHTGENNQGWLVGAGLQLNLGRLGLRLEWSRYDDIGSNCCFTDNVDAFALGVLFRF